MKMLKRLLLIVLTLSLVSLSLLKAQKEVKAETYDEVILSCLYSNNAANASAFYMYGNLDKDLDPSYGSEWLRYDGSAKLNGAPLNMDIKFIGKGSFQGFYVEGYGEVKTNDILTLTGSYINETKKSKITLDGDYNFTYDGTDWVLKNTITKITSSKTDPKPNHVYAYFESSTRIGLNWDLGYNGKGKINNDEVSLMIKAVPNGATSYNMYIELPISATVGDMLIVSGDFLSNAGKAIINIPKTKFVWNGSTWNLPAERINARNVTPSENQVNKNNLYIIVSLDGALIPSWDVAYTGAAKLGEETKNISLKYVNVNTFYVEGFEASEGAILTLNGEYESTNNQIIVFDNESIIYKNNMWEIIYNKYKVQDMKLAYNQVSNTSIYMYGTIEGTVSPSWEIPYEGTVKINGTEYKARIKYTGHGEYDDFYFEGVTVKEGDTLEISGEFKNALTKTSLDFEKFVLVYENSKWDIEYTKYNVSDMFLPDNQKSGSNTSLIGVIDGTITPSWEIPYAGYVTLKGNKIPAQVKYTGHGEKDDFYLEGFDAKAGDILILSGEFKSQYTGNSLVFEELKIAYDGTCWRNLYTVKFLNYDGTLLLELNDCIGGSIPAYNLDTPTKPASTEEHKTYEFLSWDRKLEEISSDTTYTAVFKEVIDKYKITFLNYDDSILQEIEVEYGTIPEYSGATPIKEADNDYTYLFDSWTPELEAVIGAKTYKATFGSYNKYFTVTFLNYDGEVLSRKKAETGTIPEYTGNVPAKVGEEGLTNEFSGWTPEIDVLKEDTVYTATFVEVKKTVTITFKDYDGTVLKTVTVEYGTIPKYDGNIPSRKQTDEFKYTFDGWDKELVVAKEDAEYKAKYTEAKREYTITVKFTGFELGNKTLTLEYGSVIKAIDFIKDGFNNKLIDSNGHEVEEIEVTGNMTITVSYSEIVKRGCSNSLTSSMAIILITLASVLFIIKRRKEIKA